MNLPNKLTLARIVLIPVFMVLMQVSFSGHYLWAMVVFAVASFTDYLDGYLARKWGMVTDFGKFADPLADKILTTTAMIYFVQLGLCDPIVLIVIITREFAVSGVRMIAAGAPKGKVIAANLWGKVKTVLQMVAIVIILAMLAFAPQTEILLLVSNSLMWLVGAVTLISGIQYLWENRQYFNTAK